MTKFKLPPAAWPMPSSRHWHLTILQSKIVRYCWFFSKSYKNTRTKKADTHWGICFFRIFTNEREF